MIGIGGLYGKPQPKGATLTSSTNSAALASSSSFSAAMDTAASVKRNPAANTAQKPAVPAEPFATEQTLDFQLATTAQLEHKLMEMNMEKTEVLSCPFFQFHFPRVLLMVPVTRVPFFFH